MKKKVNWLFLFSVITVLSMAIVANAEENESFTFRGYEWGTPLEDIKEKEITPDMIDGYDYDVREDEKAFILMTTVADKNVFAWFYFDDDWKLDFGNYVINETHTTMADYYSDFVYISNALVSLYGDPTINAGFGFPEEDLTGKTRDEILPYLENGSGIQVIGWFANNGSVILGLCFLNDGKLEADYYYLQNYDQFTSILESSPVNTEGL